MSDVNTTPTSLLDAINISLSCLGETPVEAPNNPSTNVVLAKQIIEEVSRDTQSKGWWFNTSGSNIFIYTNEGFLLSENFSPSIPEEARRYISIRAARVFQSRFVGSEELYKFSFQEEQVSLAVLTQAHVRNGGNSTSFTAFPAELKNMGIEEVMFLQQSAEEKLLSLRLKTELKTADKLAAETALIGDQEDLVEQQVLTEVQETTKRGAEKDLIDAQKTQVQTESVLKSQQALTELANTAKVAAETGLTGKQGELTDAQKSGVLTDSLLKSQQALTELENTVLTANQGALLASQRTQLDAQTAIEATAEKDFYDGVVAGTQDTYRDFAAELRMMGVQENSINVRGELPFQQTPAYKKIEMLKDAAKLRLVTATETGTDASELLEVNKVMRFIGESPVTALNSNSLASECVRLLRDTDTELQGRGWDFNIDADGVIVPKALGDTPQKYREYLSVRVAILLTELYPQSGVDIQRLPKMELELRAYFKDREFDNANYSVFDNYDTASRIGINRNYDLI